MLRADLDTLQRVRAVLADAAQRGLDPAETLDQAGLLDHPVKTAAGMKATLTGTARMLEEYQVSQLARVTGQHMPTTALDTKRLVVAWLDDVAGQIK